MQIHLLLCSRSKPEAPPFSFRSLLHPSSFKIHQPDLWDPLLRSFLPPRGPKGAQKRKKGHPTATFKLSCPVSLSAPLLLPLSVLHRPWLDLLCVLGLLSISETRLSLLLSGSLPALLYKPLVNYEEKRNLLPVPRQAPPLFCSGRPTCCGLLSSWAGLFATSSSLFSSRASPYPPISILTLCRSIVPFKVFFFFFFLSFDIFTDFRFCFFPFFLGGGDINNILQYLHPFFIFV